MPIDKRQNKETIIKELLQKYKKTGKIGSTKPKDMKHAIQVASAIAYSTKDGKSESFGRVIELCSLFCGDEIDERKKKHKKRHKKNKKLRIGFPLLWGHYGDNDDDDSDFGDSDGGDGGGGE